MPGAVVPPPASRSCRGTVGTGPQEAVGRLADGERDAFQRGVQQLLAPVLRGEARPCAAHPGIEVGRALPVEVREEQRGVLARDQGGAVVQLLPGGAEDPAHPGQGRAAVQARGHAVPAGLGRAAVEVRDRIRETGSRGSDTTGRTTCAPVPMVS